MLATMEEVKKNLTQRLDEVEGAGLSEEDMARVFGEEMDKSIKNNSSVLWVWLKEVSCTYLHVGPSLPLWVLVYACVGLAGRPTCISREVESWTGLWVQRSEGWRCSTRHPPPFCIVFTLPPFFIFYSLDCQFYISF